ncbi:hypothetical protein FDECE_16113 [Fusarium decemcellulare]|nr:hypothetical protein FDECE_16113 [Fusarium decemcellulare]
MPPELSMTPVIGPQLVLQPRRSRFNHKSELAKLAHFLHLPCLDSGSIHHETARLACAIYAKCRWDGYPSASRDGPPISAEPDNILLHGQYYFVVDGEDRCPVVPSFQQFDCPATPPRPYLEAPIERSPGDDAVRRDETCRIIASSFPNETAHIVPASQVEWWKRNSMSHYTSASEQADNTRCAEITILLVAICTSYGMTDSLLLLRSRGDGWFTCY